MEEAPTWVGIVQAAIVGVIAGLALHCAALGRRARRKDLWPSRNGAAECKERASGDHRDLGARS